MPALDQGRIIACDECDTVQRVGALAPGGVAHCVCCGGRLCANPKGGLDTPLALFITALVLFLVANLFPVVEVEIKGHVLAVSMTGASLAMYRADMGYLGAVIWATTVLVPGLLIGGTIYVLTIVRSRLPAGHLRPVMVWLTKLYPWGMLDVFMLGILVTLVKLIDMADIILGPGLYAYSLLIFVFALGTARLEPITLWEQVGEQLMAADRQRPTKGGRGR